MTDSQNTAMTETPTITAEDIMLYLKEHPNFLQKHPEAMDLLHAPKDKSNGRKIADFQHYMVKKAREDREKTAAETASIIETARWNMQNQSRIQAAILKILEAESFQDFIQTITMDLTAILNVDIVSLVVEMKHEQNIPHMHTSGIRVVPEGTINLWMQDKLHILEDDIYGLEEIYGGGAGLVRSQALMRIDVSMNTPPAILAFGARDPEAFKPGQGTDTISFLTRIIERSMRAWLNLPG